jgi:hypothetical protein
MNQKKTAASEKALLYPGPRSGQSEPAKVSLPAWHKKGLPLEEKPSPKRKKAWGLWGITKTLYPENRSLSSL